MRKQSGEPKFVFLECTLPLNGKFSSNQGAERSSDASIPTKKKSLRAGVAGGWDLEPNRGGGEENARHRAKP